MHFGCSVLAFFSVFLTPKCLLKFSHPFKDLCVKCCISLGIYVLEDKSFIYLSWHKGVWIFDV